MADVHSKRVRSYNMSRIRSKNTKPEMLVRSWLHRQGYRFRLHDKTLPGKPDIVLKKYKTVIFVNGCFWHGHKNCKFAKLPTSNIKFWKMKITGNIENDKLKIKKLRKLGWTVYSVWQCRMRKSNETELGRLMKKLK
jgi:DNA mismatch endonuclease (patch repair protein)